MYYCFLFMILIFIQFVHATGLGDPVPNANFIQAIGLEAPLHNTNVVNMKEAVNLNESQKLSEYDGLDGNAPKQSTISNAGIAFELMQNAAQYYTFFSQTLSNGVYYEPKKRSCRYISIYNLIL